MFCMNLIFFKFILKRSNFTQCIKEMLAVNILPNSVWYSIKTEEVDCFCFKAIAFLYGLKLFKKIKVLASSTEVCVLMLSMNFSLSNLTSMQSNLTPRNFPLCRNQLYCWVFPLHPNLWLCTSLKLQFTKCKIRAEKRPWKLDFHQINQNSFFLSCLMGAWWVLSWVYC